MYSGESSASEDDDGSEDESASKVKEFKKKILKNSVEQNLLETSVMLLRAFLLKKFNKNISDIGPEFASDFMSNHSNFMATNGSDKKQWFDFQIDYLAMQIVSTLKLSPTKKFDQDVAFLLVLGRYAAIRSYMDKKSKQAKKNLDLLDEFSSEDGMSLKDQNKLNKMHETMAKLKLSEDEERPKRGGSKPWRGGKPKPNASAAANAAANAGGDKSVIK